MTEPSPLVADRVGRSVIVRVQTRDSLNQKAEGRPSSLSDAGLTSLSASGLVLGVQEKSLLVLTSLSLFTPLVKRRTDARSLTLSPDASISVHLEDADWNEWRPARFESIIYCEAAKFALEQISEPFSFASRWAVGWPYTPSLSSAPASGSTLNEGLWNLTDFASVAVLRVEGRPPRTLLPLEVPSSKQIKHGHAVLSVSSPFGLHFSAGLQGYTTKGVLSNLFSVDNEVALFATDLGLVPGGEGGALYDHTGRHLLGLSTPPIRRRDGSATLSLILPVWTFLPRLLELFPLSLGGSTLGTFTPDQECAHAEEELRSLVLISLDAAWGSGVLISPQGHILTSGHLFKELLQDGSSPGFNPKLKVPAASLRVRTAQHGFEWHQATLLYVSPSYVDIAVLKINPFPSMRPISFFSNPLPNPYKEPQVGDPVFVLGHGLFAPHQRLPPSVNHGILSKLIHYLGQLLIIETDAQVHSGASGGLLVAARTGAFLGLVTSNTQSHHGALYTRINSSIPGLFLHDAIHRFLLGEKDCFALLERRNPEREQLWAMKMPETQATAHSPVAPPLAPSSEFLKFAERLRQAPTLPLSKL